MSALKGIVIDIVIYVMGCYSALKQNAIPPVLTTEMELEELKLHEISPRQRKNPACFNYVWKLKTVDYIEANSKMMVTRGEEVGGMGKCWSKGTKL